MCPLSSAVRCDQPLPGTIESVARLGELVLSCSDAAGCVFFATLLSLLTDANDHGWVETAFP